MTVPAIGAWSSNAAMIADVAVFGYFDGTVLDATYGLGSFWKTYRPPVLHRNDLFADEVDSRWDYRKLPLDDGTFDTVVFDPPYKLSGTPALGEFDDRYGIAQPSTRDEVLDSIRAGALECFRVASKWLLVKCMDQVEGGKIRWQTDLVTRAVEDAGGRKRDRFDLLGGGRPQPARSKRCDACAGTGWIEVPVRRPCHRDDCHGGRVESKQAHAYGRGSTLLVFDKGSA